MSSEREPRTAEGQMMLAGFAPLPAVGAPELQWRSAMGRRVKVSAGILAIETEAREAALAAVEEAVVGLDFQNERDGQPSSVVYGDVLRAIASLRKPEQSSAPEEER